MVSILQGLLRTKREHQQWLIENNRSIEEVERKKQEINDLTQEINTYDLKRKDYILKLQSIDFQKAQSFIEEDNQEKAKIIENEKKDSVEFENNKIAATGGSGCLISVLIFVALSIFFLLQ